MFQNKLKQETTISAVIIRADGTREDLGVISRSEEIVDESRRDAVKKLAEGNPAAVDLSKER